MFLKQGLRSVARVVAVDFEAAAVAVDIPGAVKGVAAVDLVEAAIVEEAAEAAEAGSCYFLNRSENCSIFIF